ASAQGYALGPVGAAARAIIRSTGGCSELGFVAGSASRGGASRRQYRGRIRCFAGQGRQARRKLDSAAGQGCEDQLDNTGRWAFRLERLEGRQGPVIRGQIEL